MCLIWILYFPDIIILLKFINKYSFLLGLLSITSNPSGIYFPNGYISGTKKELTGYLSGSCCQPEIEFRIFDLNNNRNTLIVNAYTSKTSCFALKNLPNLKCFRCNFGPMGCHFNSICNNISNCPHNRRNFNLHI